jgi:hypothetical protein
MVKVVDAELALATVAPVHAEKNWPATGALAAIGTTVPALYDPLPVPLTTVSV